jgi:hypothetical protein
MSKRIPSSRSIREAIRTLAADWLGNANVVAIYEEERDRELVIVMQVTERKPRIEYPAEHSGFRVVTAIGPQFVLD